MKLCAFVFCGLLALATSKQNGTVFSEYILYNARIYTMETEHNAGSLQAMAISNGYVVEVSDNAVDLISRYNFPVFNMRGMTVLPGLIDSHVHLLSRGLGLSQVQLIYSNSIEEVAERIRQYIIDYDMQPGEWILGKGWDHSRFPTAPEWPTNEDLDFYFPNNPILLDRIDGHANWANSRAMAFAQIPAEDPAGGQIIRNENNDPIGIFVDNAQAIMSSVSPPPTYEDKLNAVALGIEECHRNGLTGLHDASRPSQENVDVFKDLVDQGRFDIRMHAMLDGVSQEMQHVYCTGPSHVPPLIDYGNGRLTIHSIKLLIDGAFGSRGAYLFENYNDADHNGLLLVDPATLRNAAFVWGNCGYQVNIHAIGDAANHLTLDTYEELFNLYPEMRDMRFRIEHAQLFTEQDIRRVADLGIILAVQPSHATRNGQYMEDRVGPERVKFSFTYRTFLEDLNVTLALGSDFPVEEVNPFLGLYAAVSREDLDGNPPGGLFPEQKLTIYEAVRGYTIMSAFSGFQEKEIGSLEPGKRADFIVIDRDIMEIADENPRELIDTKVLVTIFGGNCVFEDEKFGFC